MNDNLLEILTRILCKILHKTKIYLGFYSQDFSPQQCDVNRTVIWLLHYCNISTHWEIRNMAIM